MSSEILKEIQHHCSRIPSQNASLSDWKRQGKKVIGYLCNNVPREMIYAAGMLPIRVINSSQPVTESTAIFPYCSCFYSRSCFDLAVKGELDMLDGICLTYGCDVQRYAYSYWKRFTRFPFIYFLNRPHNAQAEGALEFFLTELKDFKQNLEQFSAKEITPLSLSQSIRLYNENRVLLQEIYELRGGAPQPLLSGTEVAEIVLSSMQMPPEESNCLLRQLIQQAKNRQPPLRGNLGRLHISGSIMEPRLFQMVEASGGMVVSDDLCMGSRYFWDIVNDSLEPMTAVVQAYLLKQQAPCPFMLTPDNREIRLDFITKMAQKYRVQGICFVLYRYCEPHLWDFPRLEEGLKEKGIPCFSIDVEHTLDASAATRLQAFIEMIGG